MRKFSLLLISFLLLSQQASAIEADTIQEQPDQPAYSGHVFTETEFLDGNILKLSINASEMVSPVLGIAFHLLYSEKLVFLKYDPGNFLERGGDPFYLVKNDDYSKKIIFGETLRREDSFPVGDGTVADFYFQILEKGDFNFAFESGTISTMDSTRQDIDLINWTTTQKQENSYGQASTFEAAKKSGSINKKTYAIGAIAFLGFAALFYFGKKQFGNS